MNKFKVGDRVKYIKMKATSFVFKHKLKTGITGKVIVVDNDDNSIRVVWDNSLTCWCNADNCELISPDTIKLIINDRATIVILPDGRKGVAKCHPDEEFDEYEGLRIATARAYSKDPFPKEEVKDEKKEPEYKFNVGDVVIVLDYGEGYANYESKFQEITSQENCKSVSWKGGYVLEEGTFVKIIGRGQHDNSYYGNIYAIQDFDGNGYLIGEKGIAKVEVNI